MSIFFLVCLAVFVLDEWDAIKEAVGGVEE